MELPWSVVYSSTICSSPVFPNPPLLLVESGKTIEMLLTVAVGSDIDTYLQDRSNKNARTEENE